MQVFLLLLYLLFIVVVSDAEHTKMRQFYYLWFLKWQFGAMMYGEWREGVGQKCVDDGYERVANGTGLTNNLSCANLQFQSKNHNFNRSPECNYYNCLANFKCKMEWYSLFIYIHMYIVYVCSNQTENWECIMYIVWLQ